MAAPNFHHLRGLDAWRRCDHDATQIDVVTGGVRLASLEQSGDEEADALDAATWEAWLAARGGAVALPTGPDRCVGEGVLLADPNFAPDGALLRLGEEGPPDRAGWHPVDVPPPAGTGVELCWEGEAGPDLAAVPHPTSLEVDAQGRLWAIELAAARAHAAVTPDLVTILSLEPPADGRPDGLAATRWGLVLVDRAARAVWRRRPGGALEAVEVPAALAGLEPVAVAGHADVDEAVVLWARPVVDVEPGAEGEAVEVADAAVATLERPAAYVLVVEEAATRVHAVPGLEHPLPLLVAPAGRIDAPVNSLGAVDVVIGEVAGVLGSKTAFTRYALDEHGLHAIDAWAARGFDGRALLLGLDGRMLVTTADGVRALFPLRERVEGEGRVETFAIDSGTFGCRWHRVFLDLCVPPETAVRVEARASDDLYRGTQRRVPRPPLGGYTAIDDETLPLGSRTADDVEGWVELPALDRRRFHADDPFPPGRVRLPSEDGYERGSSEWAARPMDTLEGLLHTPPGRYLWLRVHLEGTRTRTPVLGAVRATFPRPSWLDHLPAFWRADPGAAARMDALLSLFEGMLTELDARIDVLSRLFDPYTCPPESLEWLADFVALTYDERVDEPVRRQLLLEAAWLYTRRGTVPGLERLCAILSQGRVRIVEGFAVRRRDPGLVLGEVSTLGPGLALGTEASDEAPEVEQQLAAARAALEERRSGVDTPCPPELPDPLDDDARLSFYRRHAHRFSVLVFRPEEDELGEVLELAIEANKPAHTVHTLCWLDPGLRLGRNSYVGVGTRLADEPDTEPAVLGDFVLGVGTTLSRSPFRTPPPDRSGRTP